MRESSETRRGTVDGEADSTVVPLELDTFVVAAVVGRAYAGDQR